EGDARENLFAEVSSIFKSHTQAEWVETMRDADCCCEPALSISEAFEHAQTRAREMVRDVEQSNLRQLGFAYKMSEGSRSSLPHAPKLGEHTDDLLSEIGISGIERDQLRIAGVTR